VTLPPDIGLTTDIYEDLSLGAALERIATFADLAEVYSSGHHSLLLADNRDEAQACGLRLTVHGPYEGLHPGSPDGTARRAAVDAHRRHLDAAAEVGASVYVVHPDYVEEPRPRDERVVAALTRTIADLGELQRELGVRIVLENMPGHGCSHFVAPGGLDLGELGFLLDTGHAAICESLDDFLADAHLPLAHVHLHDNRGPADADDPHRPLGRGVVDAGAVLTVARYAGATVILELMSEDDVVESVGYLVEKGLVPA
jgi:sugar phosphate isomerase/epimerase